MNAKFTGKHLYKRTFFSSATVSRPVTLSKRLSGQEQVLYRTHCIVLYFDLAKV